MKGDFGFRVKGDFRFREKGDFEFRVKVDFRFRVISGEWGFRVSGVGKYSIGER